MQHEPRRYPNPGRAPSKWAADVRVQVRFANGRDARDTYTVEQLEWKKRGFDHDIAEFWRA